MRIATLASLGDTVDGGGDLISTKVIHRLLLDKRSNHGWKKSSGAAEINVIQSHTIQTTGNAQDFGDLLYQEVIMEEIVIHQQRINYWWICSCCSYRVNSIEYVTMASMGNSADFGDVSYVHNSSGSASNSTRGIIAGGRTPGDAEIIEYVTIATLGNTTDFGDLTGVVNGDVGCCTSPTRCVIGGGGAPQGAEMLFVEIASTGNAVFFGELTVAKTSHSVESLQEPGIWSTGHGGL